MDQFIDALRAMANEQNVTIPDEIEQQKQLIKWLSENRPEMVLEAMERFGFAPS